MNLLFPLDDAEETPAVPGLSYRPHYVSDEQEGELLAAIDAEPWDTSWERRRQFYGGAYGQQKVPSRPMPDWAQPLIERMHHERISERPFDQMLVNEYLPGQGIALHVDHRPFDRTMVSLSLLSDCVMDFRRIADGLRTSLLLARHSLLILSDDARYRWQHGIARRKTDRWQGQVVRRSRRLSITFRLFR